MPKIPRREFTSFTEYGCFFLFAKERGRCFEIKNRNNTRNRRYMTLVFRIHSEQPTNVKVAWTTNSNTRRIVNDYFIPWNKMQYCNCSYVFGTLCVCKTGFFSLSLSLFFVGTTQLYWATLRKLLQWKYSSYIQWINAFWFISFVLDVSAICVFYTYLDREKKEGRFISVSKSVLHIKGSNREPKMGLYLH